MELYEQLDSLLTIARDDRLSLRLQGGGGQQLRITISPRSPKRLESSDSLEMALLTMKPLEGLKPLPKKLSWDAKELAYLLNQVEKLGQRFLFEADFRKSGGGRVFCCQILPSVLFPNCKARGNDAVAVVGQVLTEVAINKEAGKNGGVGFHHLLNDPKFTSIPWAGHHHALMTAVSLHTAETITIAEQLKQTAKTGGVLNLNSSTSPKLT